MPFTIAPSTVSPDGIRQWCFTLPVEDPSSGLGSSIAYAYLKEAKLKDLVVKAAGRSVQFELVPDEIATQRVIQAASLRAALTDKYALPTQMSPIEADCQTKGLKPRSLWANKYNALDEQRAEDLSDPSSTICQSLKSAGETLLEMLTSACDELSDPVLLSQFESGLADACGTYMDGEDIAGDIHKICNGDVSKSTITITAAEPLASHGGTDDS